MFIKKTSEEKTLLDQAIDELFAELKGHDANTDEFDKITTQIEKLYKVKSSLKDENRMSKDALIAVIGNLAGIVMILGYERANVVTSKALSFVLKSKV